MQTDETWMARCIALAEMARGKTAPNPMVGSVIVHQGQVIGQGYHHKAGQPHAEVLAICDAQSRFPDLLSSSTLYVNLEPCNHYGRTPPCTEAIIQAGIKRVVVGCIDPDPRVSGQGCDRLRSAGIEVITGVLQEQCEQLNEAFIFRVQHQRPFGMLKYAMTLDGKIATDTGHSFWITGPSARQEVYKLRSHCDAVIVGGNTVRRDNPNLTTHGLTEPNPLRVVLSHSLDLPHDRQLWQVNPSAKTIIFTGQNLDKHPELVNWLRDKGVEITVLNPCNPVTVMAELGQRGCNTVLWECGGKLSAAAIASGVVQKVYAFIAPKIIGGVKGFSPVGDLGNQLMTSAIELERVTWHSTPPDIVVVGYLRRRL
jgi:diaminohydroxyphosphoribosylaminopyrimidine deaminase (EC 3.5.4.26)/5-amino-6-(5-phosphoribosylamino)uracil reductase (EC 1.1.1.193)